jgi:hypothetical protein
MYSNDAYKWGCKPNEQEAKMTEKMDCARDFDNQMGHDEDYPSTQEEKDEIKEIIEFWEINQILSFDQVESLFSHIQSLESQLNKLKSYHRSDCNCLLDDESDQVLYDYQQCTCPSWQEEVNKLKSQLNGEKLIQKDDGGLLVLKGDTAKLRELLWLNHGCVGLYGDDGEMQCGKCLIDFKRDTPQLIDRKLMLRHGKFIQTEHGEIFVPNDMIKQSQFKDSDKKVAIDLLAKINVMLVLKHGKIFNIDGKAPSWDWTIEKLDEILTQLNVKGL